LFYGHFLVEMQEIAGRKTAQRDGPGLELCDEIEGMGDGSLRLGREKVRDIALKA